MQLPKNGVPCSKQSNYVKGVTILNPQWLTCPKILVEYPHPPESSVCLGCARWNKFKCCTIMSWSLWITPQVYCFSNLVTKDISNLWWINLLIQTTWVSIIQLIYSRSANVFFANLLSRLANVLGQFSYFFRLINGLKNEVYYMRIARFVSLADELRRKLKGHKRSDS